MLEHDVVIIGGGLAGMRAALEAKRMGVDVALLAKTHPVRSHSTAAQGGINAAVGVGDSWEEHAFDTVKGSDYLGDQDAIEILCREGPHDIIELEHMGVIFNRDDAGHIGARHFGGAVKARSCFVADITGQVILHVI
ncbi:MAG TPA: FAD-dependent oxidoreductase, partial [Dehalococcoidia bacterium]|nr:FAD-dependent oxidoreductase [Dehalococcoidia bacterium]